VKWILRGRLALLAILAFGVAGALASSYLSLDRGRAHTARTAALPRLGGTGRWAGADPGERDDVPRARRRPQEPGPGGDAAARLSADVRGVGAADRAGRRAGLLEERPAEVVAAVLEHLARAR